MDEVDFSFSPSFFHFSDAVYDCFIRGTIFTAFVVYIYWRFIRIKKTNPTCMNIEYRRMETSFSAFIFAQVNCALRSRLLPGLRTYQRSCVLAVEYVSRLVFICS